MNFKQSYIDSIWLPGWFKARADVYNKVANWGEKEPEEMFFDFSKPEAGWIDVSIFSNGEKLFTFPISAAFDPFCEIKRWMEDIANDFRLSADLNIDAEGRNIIFHYERISQSEVGIRRMFVHEDIDKDRWERFSALTEPDTGLFFVYDTTSESTPVVCYCHTKQFLYALYARILQFASRSGHTQLIKDEWYYIDEGDNWRLYNTIKSPLIEWSIYSDHGYRHLRPKFIVPHEIKETVHMWAEWGDGLFWYQRGCCCGNADKFFVNTDDAEINLSSMPEVRKWYDEFDNRYPEVPWGEGEYESWLNNGWELAKKIRLLLPESVDLFYEWKNFKDIHSKYGMGMHIPYIVPDLRTIITDTSEFDLLLF